MSRVIAGRRSDINEDTLHIFEKAIKTNNASFAADYVSELELENLLPHHLSTYIQQNKLNDFLKSEDPALSLAILREFGAARRLYYSPMKLFRESGWINNSKDVYDLTEHHFGGLVQKAMESGIVVKINFGTVKGIEDLSKAIWVNHLAEDGQTFLMLKKALENTISDAKRNQQMLYTLDLGYLVPSHAKVNGGLNDAMIDNIIDEKDPSIVYGFLVQYRVLDLRYRS